MRQLNPGEIVGKYQVNKLMAKGGFAEIYTAHPIEGDTEKTVVLKMLHRAVREQDEAAYDRFKREARIASQLFHNNIVQTYDYGKLDDGQLYLVMEHVDGLTLEKALAAESPFSAERTMAILLQLLGALQEAHDADIVHRDLKPANILLCERDGEADFVKVIDWGFVKLLNKSDEGPEGTLTREGMLVGTPGYLAPEVCLGEPVTPRADLYAVGIIAYEMMVGEKAYTGNPIERARKQATEDPPKPPKHLLKEPLFKIIMRLLQRKPNKRYATVSEVLTDIALLEADDDDSPGSQKKGKWWKFWG